jgi:cell shape-determining protein MreC
VRDSLQAKNQELDGKNKELQAYKDHREGQMAGASLEGQVLAYNPSWNFVVLSIGDHQGVTTNAELIVKRGGDQIAKVRVSSVNPNTAVADVIPGSVASGVTVQPGDQVIYSGS